MLYFTFKNMLDKYNKEKITSEKNYFFFCNFITNKKF